MGVGYTFKILWYFEHLASVVFDVSNKFVLNNILNLFKKIPDIHIYSTQAVIVLKKKFKS